MNPLDFLLGKGKPTPGARPGWPPAQFPSSWGAKKPPAPVSPSVGLRGAGRLLGPAAVLADIYATGRQVFNPKDNIITRLGALGNSIENVIGSGGGAPRGSGSLQKRPEGYSTYGTYTVGGIEYDTASGRPTYMPPGSVYPSSSVAPFTPAAERAYETEKSRVAQLTAQDPELKRYEDARIKAVAPGATPEQVQSAEDIGMQIWQKKYGDTPMGRPGGAIGQRNPLMDEFFKYQSGMSPQQMQAMQATASPVQVAPGEVPYQQGDLSRATLETGYDPAQYGLSPNLVEEMKERLLKQVKK